MLASKLAFMGMPTCSSTWNSSEGVADDGGRGGSGRREGGLGGAGAPRARGGEARDGEGVAARLGVGAGQGRAVRARVHEGGVRGGVAVATARGEALRLGVGVAAVVVATVQDGHAGAEHGVRAAAVAGVGRGRGGRDESHGGLHFESEGW